MFLKEESVKLEFYIYILKNRLTVVFFFFFYNEWEIVIGRYKNVALFVLVLRSLLSVFEYYFNYHYFASEIQGKHFKKDIVPIFKKSFNSIHFCYFKVLFGQRTPIDNTGIW